jgi:hypothetical protein
MTTTSLTRATLAIEPRHSNHLDKQSRAYKLQYLAYFRTITHLIIMNTFDRSLYYIHKAKNFVHKHSLKFLYFIYIHSHLTYCFIISSCATNQNITKLPDTQKKAVISITRATTLPTHIY